MSVNEGQRTKALQIRQMRRLRLDNVQIAGGATKATIDVLTPEVASDVPAAINKRRDRLEGMRKLPRLISKRSAALQSFVRVQFNCAQSIWRYAPFPVPMR